MPISNPSLLDEFTYSSGGVSSRTGGSVSPSGDALVVVMGAIQRTASTSLTVTGASSAFSVTGAGWTVVYQNDSNDSTADLAFIAYAVTTSSPGSGAVTVTTSANAGNWAFDTHEVTGVDTTTPVLQSAQNNGTSSTLVLTFGSALDTSSEVMAAINSKDDTAVTTDPDYTEINAHDVLQIYYEGQYNNSGSPDTTVQWSDLNTASNAGVAIEIASAGGTSTVYGVASLSGAGSLSAVGTVTSAPGVVSIPSSIYYTPDISIDVSHPLWSSARFSTRFGSRIESYSHQKSANGGDISASIGLNIDEKEAVEWLRNGLGRDIMVYNFNTSRVWRGFVNQIDIAIGSLSMSRGPLLDVATKVIVKFDGMYTDAAEDTGSQAKYGVRYKVVQSNTKSLAIANLHRDTYLQENKSPITSPPNLGQENASSMTINCLGYYNMLAFPYLNLTDDSTTVREKLIDILEQEPNSIFSTNYLNIETNTLSVFTLEKDFPQANEVIKSLMDMGGDSNDNRRIYGIDGDLQFSVREVPSTIKYSTKIKSETNILRDTSRAVVQPIDIKAGEWVRLDDFLFGLDLSPLRENPSMVFIETVDYTYPFGYSITGGKTDTLPQKLAKLGLGSI